MSDDARPGQTRVMTVECNYPLRDGLLALIGDHPQIEIVGSPVSLRDALRQFSNASPEVTVVDMDMPNEEGLKIVQGILRQSPGAKIIALITYEWDQMATAAHAAGAVAFLPKDRIGERLVPLILESSPRM